MWTSVDRGWLIGFLVSAPVLYPWVAVLPCSYLQDSENAGSHPMFFFWLFPNPLSFLEQIQIGAWVIGWISFLFQFSPID